MNNKELEDFLDQIPGLPKEPKEFRQKSSNEFQEIDVGSLLQQRIMSRMQQQQQMPVATPQQNNQMPETQYEKVFLREGQIYYKAIPARESVMPLAITAGPIYNSVGKEFINKGARKYYVVEGNQAVDLSNPDYSKMKILYAVEAPWIGTILVPESSIIRQNNGRQLLKG